MSNIPNLKVRNSAADLPTASPAGPTPCAPEEHVEMLKLLPTIRRRAHAMDWEHQIRYVRSMRTATATRADFWSGAQLKFAVLRGVPLL